MDLKPQNFFIGVVDFFSVWLPGSILTWFLVIMYYNEGIADQLRIPDQNAARIIAFLLIAYTVGCILFGFSSLLDNLYDKKLRKWLLVKNGSKLQLELKTASVIKNGYINSDEWIMQHLTDGQLTQEDVNILYRKPYRSIINTYKWSVHYLLYKCPEGWSDVKRLEADSKFFRSLVLTFLVIAIILYLSTQAIGAGLFLLLLIISLFLYTQFRYKATVRAYELVITHHCLQSTGKTPGRSDNNTNAPFIKAELPPALIDKKETMLKQLLTGITKPVKRISVDKGGLRHTGFAAVSTECWYCIAGSGTVTIKGDTNDKVHYLYPNSMLPIVKGSNYYFTNNGSETLELLVMDQV